MMSKVLSIASAVHVTDDVLFNDLQGEVVLLNLKTGIYFGLDPVGTRAWQLIQDHGLLGPVKDAMLQEYEVSAEDLWEDLRDLVTRLADSGLVEVIDEGVAVE
jgi:hypothetical protein